MVMDTFQGRPLIWNYVNLASRPDRNSHAIEQFEKHGIDAHRFEAYTPDQWTGPTKSVARMRKRTSGAVGCYMSQLELIKSAIGTDNVVAVCEDDVCFSEDLEKRIEYVSEHLTWDWDIFYLGATFHVPGVWCKHSDCQDWGAIGHDVEPTSDKHIMRVYGEWGTYAYFVNGRNAQKVADLLEGNSWVSDGIDHNFMRLGDKVEAYCIVPGAAWQYDNQSNIGEGMTIFSGFKKLGPYVWTDYMEDFDPDTYDWAIGSHDF